MNATDGRYTQVAIVLHWLIAILVVLMIGLGLYMVEIPKGTPDRAVYFNLHKSIGVTIAVLVLLRLFWRARHSPPPLPASMSKPIMAMAKLNHALLYVCMVLMPLSGFAASQFNKYGVTVFGLFKIPPLATESKETYEFLQSIHEATSEIFIALIVIHLLAALKHLVMDKDGVFQRMLPGKS